MSSDLAKSYHSINIGEINTWDDWHIVPSSRPLIAAPQVKTSFISLPGGDGALDLTEALAGRPTYERRTGSWEFIVMNDYGTWYERYSEIMAYLQGMQYRIIFDDDPDYYYIGRLAVNEWRSEPNWSRIVINYNVDPYKRSVDGYGDHWLWDPFDFETGTISDYYKLIVDESLTIDYINGSNDEIRPIINSSTNTVTMTFDSTTYTLDRGPNVFYDITFPPGTSRLVFTGDGVISIENIGGQL